MKTLILLALAMGLTTSFVGQAASTSQASTGGVVPRAAIGPSTTPAGTSGSYTCWDGASISTGDAQSILNSLSCDNTKPFSVTFNGNFTVICCVHQ